MSVFNITFMEANSVEFRKVAYTVNSVSKVYFRALTECLRDLGDVDNLSNSAKAIKKVIIPTIPEEVIIKGELDEEFYVWHQSIEPEEINELILKVVGCFRLQQIKKAEEKGDKEELKQHQEGLELVEKYLQPTPAFAKW
ncbi:MAG: hypothetical protein AAF614_32245 [Chloroflexota bacterium]